MGRKPGAKLSQNKHKRGHQAVRSPFFGHSWNPLHWRRTLAARCKAACLCSVPLILLLGTLWAAYWMTMLLLCSWRHQGLVASDIILPLSIARRYSRVQGHEAVWRHTYSSKQVSNDPISSGFECNSSRAALFLDTGKQRPRRRQD